MVDMNHWRSLRQPRTGLAGQRAADAWFRIQEKPTVITLVRNQTVLAAQTVRVEYDTGNTDVRGEGGSVVPMRDAVIFGIQDHPSLPNTDIKQGDRFALNGQQFKVESVVYTLGEIQATVTVAS